MLKSDGSVVWHCFNCGYATAYTPGQHLSYKFRKLLQWLGVNENDIKWLVIEAIRIKESLDLDSVNEVKRNYEPRLYNLPADAKNVLESKNINALEYLLSRNIDPYEYDFYTSDSPESNLNRRIIIPFMWDTNIVGYTARTWDSNVKKKYYAQYDKHFVFNINRQSKEWKYVLVCEGSFDAMGVHGVAVMSNECNIEQVDLIDSLGKEVIVVPDFDITIRNNKKMWDGSKLIDHAIEYGWSVSFPVWAETCKDVSDAVKKYGRLFTLKSILEAKESSALKIQLKKKAIFG